MTVVVDVVLDGRDRPATAASDILVVSTEHATGHGSANVRTAGEDYSATKVTERHSVKIITNHTNFKLEFKILTGIKVIGIEPMEDKTNRLGRIYKLDLWIYYIS